jgi:hypothetical protein
MFIRPMSTVQLNKTTCIHKDIYTVRLRKWYQYFVCNMLQCWWLSLLLPSQVARCHRLSFVSYVQNTSHLSNTEPASSYFRTHHIAQQFHIQTILLTKNTSVPQCRTTSLQLNTCVTLHSPAIITQPCHHHTVLPSSQTIFIQNKLKHSNRPYLNALQFQWQCL